MTDVTHVTNVTHVTKQGLVLIIEDDDATRELMVEAIAGEPCTVLCAADGAEALRLLAGTHTPDVILLDWRMPVPGSVFARQYHESAPPHAPIVVVSAATEIVEAARQVRASGFLRKPFDLDELVGIVQRYVRRSHDDPVCRHTSGR